MIDVGTAVDHSRAAIEHARAHEGVWATAGVHPHEATRGVDGLADLLDDECVVAVGECGLDYHYDHSPRPVQREVFAAQVALAHELDLPLVVHTREAWDDTFGILESGGVPDNTVIHCFTGGPDEARRALDLGAYLSFSGIVTFPSADDVRGAARLCPLDRLLVETDTPYLAPVPHRGRRNQPAWVGVVGAAIADLKGLAMDEIAGSSWSVATAVYGLGRSPKNQPR
jgi:TatD DNase family protein